MKILLDECVTKLLKRHLTEYEVYTVRELELSGIQNGKLLKYCVENGFDMLLTIDKNVIFQQNLDTYPVTIVLLNSLSSKIEELVTFLPSFKEQVDKFQKNRAYIIDK